MYDCSALGDDELDVASDILANWPNDETGRTEPCQDAVLSGPASVARFTPRWMRATDDLSHGHRLEPRAMALTRRYTRLNTNKRVYWLVFDIDRANAGLAWDEANVAAPQAIVTNPLNGHAHLVYLLRVPVCTSIEGRRPPVAFLEAVIRGMTRRLGADPGFRNYLAKNPLHPAWRTCWWQRGAYQLHDLAVFLEAGDMQIVFHTRDTEFAEAGRNCWLTSELGKYGLRIAWRHRDAGGNIELFRDILKERAFELNQQLDPHLRASEVHGIVRSVTKWSWRKSTAAALSEIQRRRALVRRRRKEQIIRELPDLSALTSSDIAEILGCSKRNARRYHAIPPPGI